MTRALGHARNDTIDVFRALAIAGVMAHHYSAWQEITQWGGGAAHAVLELGRFGVHIFFVVSGVVIAMTLQKTSTFSGFVLKRFARIYPAYLVAVVVTASVTALLPAAHRFAVTPYEFLQNLSPYGHRTHYVDDSYWSLHYEIQFYVLAAIVQQLLGLRLWIGMAIATALGAVVAFVRPDVAANHMLCAYLPLFLLGVSCWAFAYEHDRSALIGFAVALICYVPDSALFENRTHVYQAWQMNLFILGFSGLLVALLCFKVRFSPPGLPWLGRISYSLYLVHQVLGLCVIGTLRSLHVPPVIAVIAGAAVMIGIAWLMFLFVEERGRDWVLAQAPRVRASLPWLRGDRGKGKLPAP